MTKYGKNNDDGSPSNEATECILTGIPTDFENSIREKVPGTNYFYRVVSHQYHRITDAHRAYWRVHAGDEKIPKLDTNGEPIADPVPPVANKTVVPVPVKLSKKDIEVNNG